MLGAVSSADRTRMLSDSGVWYPFYNHSALSGIMCTLCDVVQYFY